MTVLVRIPTPLRTVTKGAAEVQAEADTVRGVIDDLERQYPGFRDRVLDGTGEIRRFINVYVNEEDVRFLDGDKTALRAGDQLSIVPAIAGGALAASAGGALPASAGSALVGAGSSSPNSAPA
jgi:molybdopterin synthase sulfur carrier subunit